MKDDFATCDSLVNTNSPFEVGSNCELLSDVSPYSLNASILASKPDHIFG